MQPGRKERMKRMGLKSYDKRKNPNREKWDLEDLVKTDGGDEIATYWMDWEF